MHWGQETELDWAGGGTQAPSVRHCNSAALTNTGFIPVLWDLQLHCLISFITSFQSWGQVLPSESSVPFYGQEDVAQLGFKGSESREAGPPQSAHIASGEVIA